MKRMMLMCAILGMATMANAQKLVNGNELKSYLKQAPANQQVNRVQAKTPRKLVADNKRSMGTYFSDKLAEKGIGLTGIPGDLVLGTPLPDDILARFNGGTIRTMRVGLCADLGNVGASIYELMSDGKIVEKAKGTITTGKTGWNEITLETPYVINTSNGSSLFLALSYNQVGDQNSSKAFPISLVAENDIQNTYVYVDLGRGQGKNWYNLTGAAGNLSVQAIVEKEYPAQDVVVNGFAAPSFVKKGEESPAVVSLYHFGNDPVTSYTLKVDVDGVNRFEQTYNEALGYEVVQKEIKFPTAAIQVGKRNVRAYISAVNGAAPKGDTTDDEIAGSLKVYHDKVNRQMQLIEHFTSTTCTYCPLGINLLKKYSEKRGDIAWVSIHGTMNPASPDPMNTTQCDTLMAMAKMNGFPSAGFNRVEVEADTYATALGYQATQYDAAMKNFDAYVKYAEDNYPALVTLDVAAIVDQTKDSGKTLEVTVIGQGVAEAQGLLSGYGLYVFITESGLISPQLYTGTWKNKYEHNHTFRAALTKVTGDAITWNGDNFEKKFTYTLNDKFDPTKMHAVAFVAPIYNFGGNVNFSNLVVNQTIMKDFVVVTSGIENLNTTAGELREVARYNAAGQLINTPQKGINIVKYANGKTAKVVVD